MSYITDPAAGGATFQSAQSGGIDWPASLLSLYASGTPVYVSNSNPVPISDAGGIITVDGTVNATQSGTWNVICTNAGTFAVQVTGDALTALQLLDDAVATTGAAITAKGFAASGTDGTNARILKTDASGELQVDVLTMPTVTVSGNVIVTNAGTFVVQVDGAALTALQLIDDGIATVGAAITSKGMAAVGTDGTNARIIKTDTNGELQVDVLSMPSVTVSGTVNAICTNAGTFVVQVDGTALTSLTDIETNTDSGAVVGNGAAATAQRITLANDSTGVLATVTTVTTVGTLTGGGVANDAADSGNPVKTGTRAAATLSDDTMVANADRVDSVGDLDGALITRPQFPLSDLISERVSNTDGTSTAFTNFGATASTRNYIYGYSIFRTDAGTTPIYVDFRDGTGGAILWSVVVPPNGGANLSSDVPLFRSTANTAIAYDVSTATSTVYISAAGFKSKV